MTMTKKGATPPRLVVNCTEEYRQDIIKWAKEEGFSTYGDYVKHCILQQRAFKKLHGK